MLIKIIMLDLKVSHVKFSRKKLKYIEFEILVCNILKNLVIKLVNIIR